MGARRPTVCLMVDNGEFRRDVDVNQVVSMVVLVKWVLARRRPQGLPAISANLPEHHRGVSAVKRSGAREGECSVG